MKCIVAGSRNFNNYKLLKQTLDDVKDQIDEIVSGAAKGADALGERYAFDNKIKVKQFPADWTNLDVPNCKVGTNPYGASYNKLAGFNRNEKMAEYADMLIAFNVDNSNGTEHMITTARDYGLKVIVVNIKSTNSNVTNIEVNE